MKSLSGTDAGQEGTEGEFPAASLHVGPPLACVAPCNATRLLITCRIIKSPTVSHELMAFFLSCVMILCLIIMLFLFFFH